MKKLISFEQAARWATVLFGLFVLFHFGIILGILLFDYAPVEFLWGGRLSSAEELLRFEILSLIVMSFCLLTVAVRSKQARNTTLQKVSTVMLWVLVVLFTFNTIGNLLAESLFEKFFSLFTVLFALLCLRLALGTDRGS